MAFEMVKERIVGESALAWEAGEEFDLNDNSRQAAELLVATSECLSDNGPRREPVEIRTGQLIEAKGERGLFSERQKSGKKIQFLCGHFGETIEPDPGNTAWKLGVVRGGGGLGEGAELIGGQVDQSMFILQMAIGEPGKVSCVNEADVMEFGG